MRIVEALVPTPAGSTSQRKKHIGCYPRVRVEGGGRSVVSQAGSVLLVETVRKSGLNDAMSAALAPWRKPRAVHDPGKVLLDVALATALGGDCLADVAMLRAEPGVFGPAASDPTVSRLIDALAAAGPKALTAIRTARAEVLTRVWELAGADAPARRRQRDRGHRRGAGPRALREAGRHRDLEEDLRPSSARRVRRPRSSGVRRAGGRPAAARQRRLQHRERSHHHHPTRPGPTLQHLRQGRQTLIRTDATGGTHAFLDWLSRPGRWLSHSVGMTITDTIHQAVLAIPEKTWTPAYDAGGTERPGTWVADLA